MSELKPIKCKAAILYEIGKPLKIENVLIDVPGEDQVRLQMVSAGLCASDAHHVWGEQELPAQFLPMVMGHEGAAIVESVGANVTSFKTGDFVLTTFMPQCRKCSVCLNPRTNLCEKENGMAVMSQANKKLASSNSDIFGYCGLGTYSEFILVRFSQIVKIKNSFVNLKKLENLASIGCGIGCGFYSAVSQVTPGTTAAIFGLGTVGLNVAFGCKIAGVKNIIGIDINDDKKTIAVEFGVTEFVSSKTENLEKYLSDKKIQVDYAFECVGNQTVLDTALQILAPFGKLVFIGVSPQNTEIRYPAGQLLLGRSIVGTLYGNKQSTAGCTELVQMYTEGKYDIDRLITNKFNLQQINEAFQILKDGKCVKSIIVF